jgi:hypothetical protein
MFAAWTESFAWCHLERGYRGLAANDEIGLGVRPASDARLRLPAHRTDTPAAGRLALRLRRLRILRWLQIRASEQLDGLRGLLLSRASGLPISRETEHEDAPD